MACVSVSKDQSLLHLGKKAVDIQLVYFIMLNHLIVHVPDTYIYILSLENMYKELASDIEGFEHPKHGDLTGWAQQGIFANTLERLFIGTGLFFMQKLTCHTVALLIRCVIAECRVDRQSSPGKLAQRSRLGDVHRLCRTLAQQQPGRPRLHAVGLICSEERGHD